MGQRARLDIRSSSPDQGAHQVTRSRAPIVAAIALASASGLVSAQVPQGVETFDAAWTIIKNTHFDKTMNGLDWNAVRTELEPKAAVAKTPAELRAVIREMLGRLGLSHFALIPSTADAPGSGSASSGDSSGDPGIEIRLLGRDLVVTHVGPEVKAPVRAGWRIMQIGSTAAADLLKGIPETDNERLQKVEAWRVAQTRLRGPAGSKVEVTFEDGLGAPVKTSLERRPEHGNPVTVGNLPTMYVRVEKERKSTASGKTAGVITFNV